MTPEEQHRHSEALHARQRVRQRRQRLLHVSGLTMLFAGYATLAISPDTPSEWVLIRVAVGFGLLFSGFGLAILPWLARISGADD